MELIIILCVVEFVIFIFFILFNLANNYVHPKKYKKYRVQEVYKIIKSPYFMESNLNEYDMKEVVGALIEYVKELDTKKKNTDCSCKTIH